MNAHDDQPDDVLVQWLVDQVESRASGTSLFPLSSHSSDAALSRHQRRVVHCLGVLDRVWPARPVANRAPVLPGWRIPGYEILNEVGRGGMGLVYRARQISLDREVALKILPPAVAANPERLQRFRTEATVAARLTDARIVTVIDVVDSEGGPVLVMPFIDGHDLGRIIDERRALRTEHPPAEPHPLAKLPDKTYLEALWPILDQLIDAVAVVHGGKILHRDIKPANVLVDRKDNVRLTDFGLARLGESRLLTTTGQGMGTAGYMSPEQWDGAAEIDGRADVFSLSATIYQTLTLRLPYGKDKLTKESPSPVAPSAHQRLLNRDIDTVLLKALEPDCRNRYQTAAEFRDDWRRVRTGLIPRARRVGRVRRFGRFVRLRRKAMVILLVFVVLLGVATILALNRPTLPLAPTYSVRVTSQPANARVVLVPIDNVTGKLKPEKAIRPAERTPLTIPKVPAGEYLVEAEVEGHGFHEVFRKVPEPTTEESAPGEEKAIPWRRIRIPDGKVTAGMAPFAGGEFTAGTTEIEGVPPHRVVVAPFCLDTTEVTVGAYRMWSSKPDVEYPPDNHAITKVTYDDAVRYAEWIGKRLPDEFEYEYAATAGGTTKHPWGNEPLQLVPWKIGPVREPAYDRTPTEPSVFGLFSNVAEWTTSWNYPYPSAPPEVFAARNAPMLLARMASDRIVRGAPTWVVRGELEPKRQRTTSAVLAPRRREGFALDSTQPGLGFRCARSAQPRFLDP